MSRTCLRKELPLACQDCYYLHCDHLRMDGKNDWSCMMRNVDVKRDFKNGKSCVDDYDTEGM